MLWLYQRTMFGKVENPKNEKLPDLNLREVVTFVPLIILAVWIGIYPAPFLNRLAPTVNSVVARINPAYPAVASSAGVAKEKDCESNKALTAFTLPPCGDAAAAPAAQGAAPTAKPTPAGGEPRDEATEPASAGGRH
jgi:NADH-quinone oxidoreductase subunit M